ncbi:MAG: hypothetical protein ABT11_16960 [Novosphingobium sp. SCN 66-18]|nr:MAG: hypothetical protein ABT11_16960 [Novosphingobium sp. SCN 66-18]
MKNAMRVIAGLLGLFNVAIGLGFLLDPAIAGQRFFLASLGTQGMATLRADFTALFVGMGLFALAGAWKASRALVLVPVVLLPLALIGRGVSLIADGAPATAFPPMIVEAAMIAILVLAARSFDEKRG